MYDRLEREAVDRLLPPAPHAGKLLEVGCGTGHWSEYFAGKGFAVTGVDVSERMIAVARQKNIAGGTFEVADAERLPFAGGSFDVAAAITALEFTPNPARVVSEMTRCVRKAGGMLILGVLNGLSAYNQSRKRRIASMYASAKLFSPADLRTLLAQSGELTILVAGFVPRWDSLVWLSPLLERLGRLTGDEHGVFLAAKVVL
jgi:ubiquinone/menaquinone biosynthesis C-methylase UbiE